MNNMDMSDFIDPTVKSGSGVNKGDILKGDFNGCTVEMKVVGFDNDKCPFVKYTKVKYAEGSMPSGEKEGDEINVGDVMPFPWSDPAQYKI